jgi:hypothetical protein
MAERYLDRHVLVFNRDLLKDLFTEADFRKEGSLDMHALKAALSGVCFVCVHVYVCVRGHM